jgi:hypothetical protein
MGALVVVCVGALDVGTAGVQRGGKLDGHASGVSIGVESRSR